MIAAPIELNNKVPPAPVDHFFTVNVAFFCLLCSIAIFSQNLSIGSSSTSSTTTTSAAPSAQPSGETATPKGTQNHHHAQHFSQCPAGFYHNQQLMRIEPRKMEPQQEAPPRLKSNREETPQVGCHGKTHEHESNQL